LENFHYITQILMIYTCIPDNAARLIFMIVFHED